MDPQTAFMLELQALMEGFWPDAGPFEIVKFNDNTDPLKYTALVLDWWGTINNEIVKKLFKVWKVGGVLTYAEVAKSEWPVGI